MPLQRSRRPSRELAPAERLTRAISNIDKHLDEAAARNKPIPLSAHRARRILEDALLRCQAPTSVSDSTSSLEGSSQTGPLVKTLQSRRGRVERHKPLPSLPSTVSQPQDFLAGDQQCTTANLSSRDCGAARKRNRLKLASAALLGIAVAFGLPAAIAQFF